MRNRMLNSSERRHSGVIAFPGQERRRPSDRPRGEYNQRRRKWRLDPYRLITALVFVYFVVTAVSQQLVIIKLQAQQAELQSQIETTKSQQAALRQRLAYLQTDDYIVQEARGRFGLAHPGEIHYRTIDAGEVTKEVTATANPPSPHPTGAVDR